VKRKHRLRRYRDIKRVRRLGKSYAHPFIVLIYLPTSQGGVRVSVIAGRGIGNAVQRNRAKRQLRSCMEQLIPLIEPDCDLAVLARKPIRDESFTEIKKALVYVLQRAKLVNKTNDH